MCTTLDRLERDGLVVPVRGEPGNGNRSHRTVAITSTGLFELGRWRRVVEPGEVPRDELVMKVLVALADPRAPLDVITAQRTALYARLQAMRRDGGAGDLAAELVHDAVAVRAEADLRWLDRCEARVLERLANESPTGAGRRPGDRRERWRGGARPVRP